MPSYIQKSIRPQKQVPNYGKNVDWLHNKMKLKVSLPGGEAGYVNYKCTQFKGQSFIVQSWISQSICIKAAKFRIEIILLFSAGLVLVKHEFISNDTAFAAIELYRAK